MPLISLLACLVIAQVEGGIGGGGPLGAAPQGECIPPLERKLIETQIASFHAKHGRFNENTDADPTPYPQFPMGANLYRDAFINNFTDLDSSSGIRDFEGTDITYNGHQGHDIDLRTFGEQELGVPVFAALDGVVSATRDFEFDKNTSGQGQPANYVVLYHGGQHYSLYWHLKRGSVNVSVGQSVRAGHQLGLTASSGNSTGPHLHFESWNNGTWYEPCAGSNRPGPSFWESQQPVLRTLLVRDLNITPYDLSRWPGLPYDMPREAGTSPGRRLSWWINVHNQPAFSTYRAQVLNPNGSTLYDSGTVAFNNSTAYRWAWWWWWYNFSFSSYGTHRLRFFMNGSLVEEVPFLVSPQIENEPNGAPYAVTASLSPRTPAAGKPIYVRVNTSLILDDPDFDIVQFKYRWVVDGAEVRSIRHAGQADALAAGVWSPGKSLICYVTPTDGQADGPTAMVKFVGKP
ncbi:MAG TPA: M23 family metallopeptidase [Fimbriimonadaceae bacterium]|nr:M23 family metallopeptidase [Fimbriimonadaceae bacterium]